MWLDMQHALYIRFRVVLSPQCYAKHAMLREGHAMAYFLGDNADGMFQTNNFSNTTTHRTNDG
jgi:hypothetical protein